MDFSQILLIFVSAINLLLAIYTYSHDKKNFVNISFALFTVFLSFWSLALFFTQITSKMIWANMSFASGTLMGVSFVFFSWSFPKVKKKIPSFISLFTLIPASIFIIALPFGLVLKGFEVEGFSLKPQLGPLYPLFMIYVVSLTMYGLYILISKYRRSSGREKVQIKYLFWGFTLFAFGSLSTNVVFPIFGFYNLNNLGPAFSLFLVGSVAYAITRYRLMDIRLVIGRGVVYLFSFSIVIALGLALSYFNGNMTTPIPTSLLLPIILIVGILLFPILFNFYEKFAAQYFYYTFYSHQKVLTELGQKLTGILSLEKLNTLIANTLIDTMKLTKVGIILKEVKSGNHRIQKVIGFKKENGLAMIENDFLTSFLEKNKKPLIYEELSLVISESSQKREEMIRLQENMQKIDAEALLPLLIESKIIGIIVLGKKMSGEPYSAQDVELLSNLANQSAIAFQNSIFYQEVEDLSKNLERRVKEQVKQIETLSEMKTEFLKVVNHQLRTPVSIIKGMSSMLAEEKLPERKKRDFAKKLYLSSERLNTILDDILVAQNLMGGPTTVDLRPCKIDEVIEREIKHRKYLLENKDLKIVFKKPKKPIPTALFDEEIINRILSRLIDNAALYTERGKIEISLEQEEKKGKKFIKISIKDSGIGLNKKDKNNLFKLFHRGEKATSLHPNGSGLGLFIVKNLAQSHKGSVKAESKGRGKGTTFIVKLPFMAEV